MRRELGLMVAVSALWACGGQTFTAQGDAGADGGSSSGGSSGGSGSSSGGSSSSSGSSSGGSSGGSSSSSGSSSGGEVPVNHRVDDSQCSQPAPPGNCGLQGGGPPGECSKDTDCNGDAGSDGRCVESTGGALYCMCTYDTCQHDTDCPSSETCACHGSTYSGGGNACVTGNCRVDSNCGVGGYCSPSYATMGCGGLAGYYCHTPNDLCVNDSDCGTSNGLQVCVYTTATSRWECHQQLLCG